MITPADQIMLAQYPNILFWDHLTEQLVCPVACRDCGGDGDVSGIFFTSLVKSSDLAYCRQCFDVLKTKSHIVGYFERTKFIQDLDKRLFSPVQSLAVEIPGPPCDRCNGSGIALGWTTDGSGTRAIDVPGGCKICQGSGRKKM